ncbi:MAG: hypothetical protein Q8R18_06035, partial [bacterium]|nr:hypothetical protein [bacterium]
MVLLGMVGPGFDVEGYTRYLKYLGASIFLGSILAYTHPSSLVGLERIFQDDSLNSNLAPTVEQLEDKFSSIQDIAGLFMFVGGCIF